MKKFAPVLFSIFLSSCSNLSSTGTINFVLEEGSSFADPNFSTTFITGESNTIIINGLPQAKKEGYYFVGWREYINGSYQFLQKRLITDSSSPFYGQQVYLYPYGSTTLYTYFEPEETIVFDLNISEEFEPKLVAPTLTNRDFNLEEKTLYGYEKKEFSSTNYFPTATCLNKTFSHWAIEYPLTESVDPNTNRTFFIVDYNKEKGLYNFFDYFKTAQSFSFPRVSPDTNSLTLKAIWTDNTNVNIDLGLEGLSTSFFAQNQNIRQNIISCIETNLGQITYNEKQEIFIRDGEYKLIGCFLDSNYTYEFPISSNIAEVSLDLYLLWGKKINLTLDYNGGKVGEVSTKTYTCYGKEKIPLECYSSLPIKESTYFNYYQYNEQKVDLSSFVLPNEDITLIANYTSFPKLILSYQFPDNYTYDEDTFKDVEISKNIGSDISSYITAFLNKIDSLDDYVNKKIEYDFLLTSINDSEVEFSSTLMPGQSTLVYLKIYHSSKINLVYVDSSDNQILTSFSIGYLTSHDTNIPVKNIFPNLYTHLGELSEDYVYSGLFFDQELTRANIEETISGSRSNNEIEINIYKKLTHGKLYNFNGEVTGSIYMVENTLILDNKKIIEETFGIEDLSLFNFYILDSDTKLYIDYFPSNQSNIYLEYK